jgi:hypothetical protein
MPLSGARGAYPKALPKPELSNRREPLVRFKAVDPVSPGRRVFLTLARRSSEPFKLTSCSPSVNPCRSPTFPTSSEPRSVPTPSS